MIKENKITINNLIYSLLFLVFGIILLTSSDDIIGMVSKAIGIILVIVGIIKSVIYIYMKGKLGEYKSSELIIGLCIIGFGVLLILFSSTLSFAIRVVIGLWALFAGINRIIFAISVKSIDNSGFKMYLISAMIMIIVGILLISGLFDKIIGLLIIIYSISEIADYIYFRSKHKVYESTDNKPVKVSKKDKKAKNGKVVDAVIEEETDEN